MGPMSSSSGGRFLTLLFYLNDLTWLTEGESVVATAPQVLAVLTTSMLPVGLLVTEKQ